MESVLNISVVIDNYNSANYIAEAIESVLNQSYQPTEIIIIDDGSKDHSVEVIKQYSDKHAHITLHEKTNGGQLSCISQGILNSSENLIALLDGDDVWKPHHLEHAIAHFTKHPELSMYACNYESTGASDGIHWHEEDGHFNETVAVTFLSEAFLGQVTSSLVFKATCVKPHLPLSAPLEADWKIHADNVIVWLCSLTGKQKIISSKENIFYRYHPANMHKTTRTRLAKSRKRLATKRLFTYWKSQFYYSDGLFLCLIREYKAHPVKNKLLKKNYLKAIWNPLLPVPFLTRIFFDLKLRFR